MTFMRRPRPQRMRRPARPTSYIHILTTAARSPRSFACRTFMVRRYLGSQERFTPTSPNHRMCASTTSIRSCRIHVCSPRRLLWQLSVPSVPVVRSRPGDATISFTDSFRLRAGLRPPDREGREAGPSTWAYRRLSHTRQYTHSSESGQVRMTCVEGGYRLRRHQHQKPALMQR